MDVVDDLGIVSDFGDTHQDRISPLDKVLPARDRSGGRAGEQFRKETFTHCVKVSFQRLQAGSPSGLPGWPPVPRGKKNRKKSPDHAFFPGFCREAPPGLAGESLAKNGRPGWLAMLCGKGARAAKAAMRDEAS